MKVFLTKRNSDMNEGRGQMVNDLCFANRVDAENYIDSQSGIMGRRAKWSNESHGDWEIEEIKVIEHNAV